MTGLATRAALALGLGLALPQPGWNRTVCGFDDTAIATTIWPELTTMRQPIGEMSHAAMVLLMKAARARRAGQDPERAHIVLDHALTRRVDWAETRNVFASLRRSSPTQTRA